MPLTIRNAKLKRRACALPALMCALGYETTTAEMQRRSIAILNYPRYDTFVAEIDNKVRE